MAKAKTKITTKPEKQPDWTKARQAFQGEVKAFLDRVEKLCIEHKADSHAPERAARARAVAYSQITDLLDLAFAGDLHPITSRDEANRWIDAALGAGISFDRIAEVNKTTGEVEITYRMRLAGISGSDAIADAFTKARAYGPKLFDDVLTERFGAKSSEPRLGKTLSLDGGCIKDSHFHTLPETATELRMARLRDKAKSPRSMVYEPRPS